MDQLKHAIIDLVQQSYWAITPRMLDTIHEILYNRCYLGKEQAPIQAGFLDDDDEDDKPKFKTVRNVRILPVIGPIIKRMNIFSRFSGGTSTELLQRDIQAATEDPEVHAIVLDVDSPGGMVDGTQNLGDFIFKKREKKPIVALANGLMASGATWLGTAASKVFASEETTQVGSIGVIVAHYDYSKAYEQAGVKKTFLYSGKYKAMGNDTEPLKDDARDYIQNTLDGIYTIFVDNVARNRGVKAEDVLKNMADGRMFLAREAVEAGLIDGVKTLDETIEYAASMAQGNTGNKALATGGIAIHTDGGQAKNINIEPLLSKKKGKTEEASEMEMKELLEKMEAMQSQVTGLQTQMKEKDGQIEAMANENKKMSKDLAITQETLAKKTAQEEAHAEKIKAEGIMDGVLAESTLSERLYPKIKNQLDHSKFRTEAGGLDTEKFTEAFKAEVKDWEDRIPKGGSLGLGQEKTDAKNEPVVLYADENKALMEQCV